MSDQSYSAQLPFAQLDLDRLQRRGVGEIIFGEGKSAKEIALIMIKLVEAQGCALTTRVPAGMAQEVRSLWIESEGSPKIEHLSYLEEARCLLWRSESPKLIGNGVIGVVTAGTSDGFVAAEAASVLGFLGHSVTRINDIGIAGLHRLLGRLDELRSMEVLIVCAGMEGALPSVVAGLVDCPVIGVPTSVGYGANFGGITALLGMINSCAAGVVVVNIDNGFGAAYTAAQINRVKA